MKIYAAQKPGERGTCYGGGAFGQYAALALALLLALPSCTEGDTVLSPPPIAMADLPTAFVNSLCAPPCTYSGGASPDDSCASLVDGYLLEGLRQRIRLVELGHLAYDADKAGLCVAASACGDAFVRVEAASSFISRLWTQPLPPPECTAIFSGTLGVGAPCEDDAECAVGRCWGWPHAVCTTPAAHDTSCGTNAPCVDGDLCLFALCRTEAPLPLHAKCDTAQNILTSSRWNDFWGSQIQCAAGTECVGLTEHDGNCQPIQKDGGHCIDWSICLSGSDCINGVCTPQPDTGDAPRCGKKWCQSSEYCADDGISCLPWAHSGESCAGGQRCLNSVCLTDSKVCSVGNPCGPSCAPSLCRADGVCLEPRIDDSCTTDKDCATPQLYIPRLACVGGHCYRTDNPALSW